MTAYHRISDARLPHCLNRARDWLLRTGWPTFCNRCDRAATRWHHRRCRHYALDLNAMVSYAEREGLALTEWQRQLLDLFYRDDGQPIGVGSWRAFVNTTTSAPQPLALQTLRGARPDMVIWDEAAPLLEHVARQGGKLTTAWDMARDWAASTGLPVHVYGLDATWCLSWHPGIGCYLYEQVRDRTATP